MALELSFKKNFGEFNLNVDFTTKDGTMGILGESGSGKSMTLKCIAGIENPDSGRIVLNDEVLFDSSKKINLPPQKRKVGYMFQNYALFPHMTIEENIAIGMMENKREKTKIITDLMEKFKLNGLENRLPGQLSGGQQQRVALARIMAYKPRILMLDEPFSALDSSLKDVMQQELLTTLKEYEGDVIMVSHSRDEIFRFCKELTIMKNGSIAAIGGTREIFSKPPNFAAARLTGCKNISAMIKISDYRIKALDWGIELDTKEKVTEDIRFVAIRGHRLIPSYTGQEKNSMKVILEGYMESPFEIQYIIKNEKYKQGTSIWWMTTKKDFIGESKDTLPPYLTFPPEKLLLLK